jgi:FtsP/CotA-like multicopper oxidase with cupredoxin domain
MKRRAFVMSAAGAAVHAVTQRRFSVQEAPFRQPATVSPADLVLTAAPGRPIGTGGVALDAWLYNDALPGPTIRMNVGDTARITLRNALPEATITHWHGAIVPESADGHPRLAVPPGASYDYTFTANQRPGLCWYHPHTHMRTGYQVHRGLAGLLIVDDPSVRVTGLPPAERELTLVLQDRTIDATGSMPFELRGPAMMAGYFGDTLLVNGVANPRANVAPEVYRLRVLNGSASRIYDLALGVPMRMIGGDGGLLSAPVALDHLMLAPAERVDLLVDFGPAAGRDVTLDTRAFDLPAGTFGPMGRGRGALMMRGRQGEPGSFMRFVVDRSPRPGSRRELLRLPDLPVVDLPRGAAERRFVFSSMMMDHTINGASFDLARRDIVSRAGAVERWTFVNDGPVPHPVHLHAAQFLVRERSGGRGRLFPWEGGWKDTVLVAPSEAVTVDVHFGPHRGLFLLHCHNLVHEDMGMMFNVQLD